MCVICRDTIEPNKKEENKSLICKHIFHKACVDEWLKEQTTCPICRKIVKAGVPRANMNTALNTANLRQSQILQNLMDWASREFNALFR